jgi:ADP-L-glycero-D-manno-heptose 6-epimerase
MRESQKPQPLNTYGYSKWLCDKKVHALKNTAKLPVIVGLRYFNVYGPGEYHKGLSASMIYQLYLQMAAGKNPRVFEHGDQKRDFIYVKDVAAATVAALTVKKGGIFNVGTGTPRSFNDIIRIINAVLGKNLSTEYFKNPYRGVYQDYTAADTTLLKKGLYSRRCHSLEEGIANYINNYLKKTG